jgi:hypothetical protein
LEQLVNLTVKEVNELVTILKEYGIEPCCNCSSISTGDGAAEEVQTEFSCIERSRCF